MKNPGRIISLVTISGGCVRLSRLTRALNEVGYSIQTFSVPADSPDKISHENGQILFLSGSDQLDGLLAKLREWPASPRLAVISEGVAWDQRILDFCSEVVSWPCSQEELLFRLERAFYANHGDTNDKLLDAFVGLNMIGQAPSFLRVLSVIRRIAKYDATVLISGETGTGKELAAGAIHYLGGSSDGPFVPVNCGSSPDELFDNELYGHVPGAYTDAKERHRGYVERADGGTLFLDEIDVLSMKSQVTLLRFLQDSFYKPLGSEQSRHANIRVVAATNTNLNERVQAGQFRQDLLFRLDVLSVKLPALRNRPGDTALLAEYFVKKHSREHGKRPRPLHPGFLARLEKHSWPGNIRELENTILRACLLSEGNCISLGDDPENEPDVRGVGNFKEQKARAIAGFERRYLQHLLGHTHGNISRAAKLAGKERRALGKLLQKHGIKRSDYVHGDR